MKTKKSESHHMLGLKIPVSLWKRIRVIAAAKDVSVSNYVRSLIRESIDKKI